MKGDDADDRGDEHGPERAGDGRRGGSLGTVSVLGADGVTRKSATQSIVRPKLNAAQDGQ